MGVGIDKSGNQCRPRKANRVVGRRDVDLRTCGDYPPFPDENGGVAHGGRPVPSIRFQALMASPWSARSDPLQHSAVDRERGARHVARRVRYKETDRGCELLGVSIPS